MSVGINGGKIGSKSENKNGNVSCVFIAPPCSHCNIKAISHSILNDMKRISGSNPLRSTISDSQRVAISEGARCDRPRIRHAGVSPQVKDQFFELPVVHRVT